MAHDAAETLEGAFRDRCCAGSGGEAARPRVGLFGDGLPEALVAAAGGEAVEVKAPPADDALAAGSHAVSAVIEDFVDPYAARFLHRFAAGWYREHAALIFARDDVAALTAYQYATELRRQNVIDRGGPRLLLWNLVHADSEAAHRFNMIQAERLRSALAETLGVASNDGALPAALAAEAERRQALGRIDAAGVAGRLALVWRNAGRWLPPGRHADLLDAAPGAAPARPAGPRIGLVGTAVIDPAFHAMLDTIGPVVADLQPYGRVWPDCHAGGPDLDALIRSVARFPLHLRAAPPERFRAALLDWLSGCDLVVTQVDTSDDGFGWVVPALRHALAARDVPLVELGFRPFRPDAAWLDTAREKVAAAAGATA